MNEITDRRTKGHGLKTPASGFDPDRLDVEIFFQVLLAGLAAIAAHLVAAERYRRIERAAASAVRKELVALRAEISPSKKALSR